MEIKRLWGLLIAFYLGFVAIAVAQDQPEVSDPLPEAPVIVMRALDKVTARITELSIPIGSEASFGTLRITPRYCRSRPPEEQPETFGFIEIDDIQTDDSRKRVFTGWMMASSPALNPLEHPVYDVWVISCRTSSGEVFTGNA